MFEKTKNKRKRGRGWPIFKKINKKNQPNSVQTKWQLSSCDGTRQGNLGQDYLTVGKTKLNEADFKAADDSL